MHMNNGMNRAESVPPSLAGLLTTNASNLMHHPQQQHQALNNPVSYMRAQSEQPFFGTSATSTANFGNAPQTPLSPVSMYPMYNNHQSLLRSHGGQQKALNNMTNNLPNNRLGRNASLGGGPGGDQNLHHQQQLFGNNILNLNPLTNNNLSNNPGNVNTNLDHLPPMHHHYGGHPGIHSHTLNNQVAPGNRANNYWDNFRR